MKSRLAFGLTMLALSLTFASPVFAKKVLTVPYNQAQFQWRAWAPFGDWSYSYLEYATSTDYEQTGKVLHMEWEYSPVVTDLEGQSSVYVYDKETELWIEHEGQVFYKYVPFYGDYLIANYFRGYLQFDGAPSAVTFIHGVAYQWVYLLAPKDWPGNPSIPYAWWDETVGAWLVGFSIYLWDPIAEGYTTQFPDPFIKPVPASNFNPLDL